MNWLDMEKLDHNLRLDRVQDRPSAYSPLSGIYKSRRFRLHVNVTLAGEEGDGGPEPGNDYRAPQDFDEDLRIVMTLENPRPIGVRIVEHTGSAGLVRQWRQRLHYQDIGQRFTARFRLDIWPEKYAAPCRLALQRRELTEGLLRTPSPVTLALGHNALTLSTPHLLSPSRSVPLVRLAFDLAEAIEPALLLAA